MKTFLDYLSEDVVPAALVTNGTISLDNEETRASVNMALAKVTADSSITPYIALNRIAKALSYFSIILPKRVYLEGSKGVEVHEIRQFGEKMGMNDQGEFIREVPGKFYLFVQYGMNTPMNHGSQLAYPTMGGTFRVTAKVVDKVELDKLISMAELALAEECDAEMQQRKSKMLAPHDEMHDVTSDPKKVGNKKAVAVSDKKKVDEGILDTVRSMNPFNQLANKLSVPGASAAPKNDGKIYGNPDFNKKPASTTPVKEENIEEVRRSSRNVSGAMAIRRSANARSEPDEIAKKYPNWRGFHMTPAKAAEEKARRIAADKASAERRAKEDSMKEETLDEGAHKALKAAGFTAGRKGSDTGFGRSYSHPKHGSAYVDADGFAHFGSGKKTTVTHGAKDTAAHLGKLKEGVGEPITGSRRHPGSADRKRKAVQMALGRKHKGEEGWNDKINPQNAALRHGRALQKKGVTKEEIINEISQKLATRYTKKSFKDMKDAASFGDTMSIRNRAKGIENASKKLTGGAKVPANEETLSELYGKGRLKDIMDKRNKDEYKAEKAAEKEHSSRKETDHRTGPSREDNTLAKAKYERERANMTAHKLKKHRAKTGFKEETQLDELSRGTVARYKKAAESDKKSAEVSADVSRAGRKNRANPLKARIEHGKEEKWLKGIAKKREKGIAMADKRLEEKLTKGMSAGDVISDFVHSDDPKFKGKSKKERQRMALGAYYGMHPEKSKK